MDTGNTDWIRQYATPLSNTDPTAPLSYLESLRQMVAGAEVVGLGESTHGAHEQVAVKHRIVRFLVEEMGFRCVVLEEDWTKGVQLNEYVVNGKGDPRALLADAGPPWRTEEILDLVTWMRSYNETHPDDKVRFAGVDIVAVRLLAYDAVTEYVGRAAPDRAGELEQHFAVIRPKGYLQQHIGWYRSQPDKQHFVDHAQQAYDLVRRLPASDGHALALQHAKAIVGFYTYHAQQKVVFRDQQMAENIIWWRNHTADKIVYWAANVHTANGPQLAISYPPFPPVAGSEHRGPAARALRQRLRLHRRDLPPRRGERRMEPA
jgi:erythromycin esterase